ncbi:MAG: adenine deaminase C-terminal domain-containing protein [Pseudomonadota bacterium]
MSIFPVPSQTHAVLGAHLAPTPSELLHLRKVATGAEPADCILRDGRVLSLHSGEILARDIVIAGRHIAAITPVGHFREAASEHALNAQFVAPTFIDTHIHIEYSLLTPGEFARCVIPKGTGCVLADPNCIGNILGADAMDWVGRTDTPLRILQQISSRIPRNPEVELGGATVTEQEQLERLARPNAVAAGESTPFDFDERAARFQSQATSDGRRNTGHTARVGDELLWGYAATGISDDHNGFTPEEVLERVRLGMTVNIMSGSMNDNVPLVFANPSELQGTFHHFTFCADDRHVDDLHDSGHIDHHIREAIARGVPPLDAYRMASLNAAMYFRLDHLLGSVTPNRLADLVLIDSLEDCNVQRVFINGELAAENGEAHFTNPDPIPEELRATMNVHPATGPATFCVPVEASSGEVAVVRAMEMYDGYFKRAFEAELAVVDGDVQPDPSKDVAKITVIDRHHASEAAASGFVRGFGLQHGALAATTNCENQNLVVVGTSTEDMAAAAAALCDSGGGYVAVKDGQVLAQLALPVAGIMSDRPWEEVMAASKTVNAAAHSLGCGMEAPFMILAFVGLAGVPDYGLTEKGLIDAPTQTFIPVVLECRGPEEAHPLEGAGL